jgi:RNA polymerase sigma-70 factor (ECF subfamily)
MKVTDFAKKIPLLSRRKRTAEGFWELARPHVKFLYNMALRYTGNSYDAEDMVQESMYSAFNKFDQLREESKMRSWLFAILRNNYLKGRQQSERMKESEYDDGIDYLTSLEGSLEQVNAEEALVRKVEAEQIQDSLDKLPEKYKSPVLLYFMEGLSYQEISETLGIPIGTVMSRLARGKDFLKKEILRLHYRDSQPMYLMNLQKINNRGDA